MIDELISRTGAYIRSVWQLLMELAAWIFSLLKKAFEFVMEHFLNLTIFNKLLVLMIIPAFFVVIKPSARFKIFDSWYYVNNPMSENMIGIVFLIAVSFFIPVLFALILRIVPVSAYFIWTLYLQLSKSISKAPYELTFWHYLNLAVPLIIIIISIFSYLDSRE